MKLTACNFLQVCKRTGWGLAWVWLRAHEEKSQTLLSGILGVITSPTTKKSKRQNQSVNQCRQNKDVFDLQTQWDNISQL